MFSRHRVSGFNLLEVVMASFLFSTLAVAFLGVWGMQVRATEKSRHKLVATLLAEQLAEEAMTKGYELMRKTEGPPEPLTIPMETESRGANGEWTSIPVTYTATTTVKEINDGPDDRLKQVIIEVTWSDSTQTGKVELETYLAGTF